MVTYKICGKTGLRWLGRHTADHDNFHDKFFENNFVAVCNVCK